MKRNWRATLQGSEFKVMRLNDAPAADTVLDNPESIVNYLRPKLAESLIYKPDVENFIVVHLNARKKPIGFEIVSQGLLDQLLVHAREVFRSAILANSQSIVVCHNHPSGDSCPSEADIKVTKDLIHAGRLLKIEVLDHVILGRPENGSKGWSSLRELGYTYA
jgi:DNA repair protein RadC